MIDSDDRERVDEEPISQILRLWALFRVYSRGGFAQRMRLVTLT